MESAPSFTEQVTPPRSAHKDVELYCEWIGSNRGVGSVGRHCFLRITQPDFDVTEEIYGPGDDDPDYPVCTNKGHPKEQPFNSHRSASRRRVHGGYSGVEECIMQAFRNHAQNLPPYVWSGPNSNTFVAEILAECGMSGDFPINAPR